MPNDTELPLDDLAVFVTVVRAGGFRAAATRLERAPSTVSETITRLEARVGTPLLTRSTRAVRPTEAGGALVARLEPLLAEARLAVEEVASEAGAVRGPLRLNVPKAVMIDILPPLVDRFLERHPEATVEILVEDRFVDAIAAGCHAGIRYGEALEQDMIAVPIGPPVQRYALAASPGYLERRGAPGHPREVRDHDCLLVRFASGALAPFEFERGSESASFVPPARLTVSAAAVEALIAHAVAGRGLIQGFDNWLEPYFESGSLVPLLRDWWPEFEGPRLYFTSRFMPTTLRAFIDLVAGARRDSTSA